MKRWIPALAATLLLLAGCDSPQRTVDTLRTEIADYKTMPTEQKKAEIEMSLDKLQTQVDEMDKKDDPKTEHFREKLATLRGDYRDAKLAKAMQDAKNGLQELGNAVKDGAKDIGNIFKGSGTK